MNMKWTVPIKIFRLETSCWVQYAICNTV